MDIINLAFIVLILLILAFFLLNKYEVGLSLSVFFLILLPQNLLIETPFNFNLTIHRLILLLLFVVWRIKHKNAIKIQQAPFFSILIWLAIINSISLFFSKDFVFSLKTYLQFTVEITLFYIIVVTSIDSEDNAFRLLRYICYALTFVAILAVIERYTGFNPVDSFIPGYVRRGGYRNDVMATYPHRILLGAAMAMGWPIVFTLSNIVEKRRLVSWASLIMILSACYFSFSRGPWIASLIAGLILFILSSSKLKGKIFIILFLIMLTMVIRPGIWDTMDSLAQETMDPYSLKGTSYQWRWELWRKAFAEVSKSPERAIFGYGPGTSEALNWRDKVSFLGGVMDDFSSWDSHYATLLLETGFLGLGTFTILHLIVLKQMYFVWHKTRDETYKTILIGLIASVVVMLFMMLNVKIFAAQLNYLFWVLVAISITLGSIEKQAKNISESGRNEK